MNICCTHNTVYILTHAPGPAWWTLSSSSRRGWRLQVYTPVPLQPHQPPHKHSAPPGYISNGNSSYSRRPYLSHSNHSNTYNTRNTTHRLYLPFTKDLNSWNHSIVLVRKFSDKSTNWNLGTNMEAWFPTLLWKKRIYDSVVSGVWISLTTSQNIFSVEGKLELPS